MANEGYHEPIEELSDETRDMHRAITSLMEELEAVDEKFDPLTEELESTSLKPRRSDIEVDLVALVWMER